MKEKQKYLVLVSYLNNLTVYEQQTKFFNEFVLIFSS